tara:strand:- start:44 stop:244 length:201 start_codon:yes stop_codon:yes gene_type:complete
MKFKGYYIVWVAPNPEFPEENLHINEGELLEYQDALKIADQLNHETKSSVGKYEVRKHWYSEQEVA